MQSLDNKNAGGQEILPRRLAPARERQQRRTGGTIPSARWGDYWLWSTARGPEAVVGQTGGTTAGRASPQHNEETTTARDRRASVPTVGKSIWQVHECVLIHP